MMSRKILCLLIFIVLSLVDIFSTETFFIISGGKILAGSPMDSEKFFTIRFIHSVQKTLVYEDLKATRNSFKLIRTRYKSFGVGLPFLETEGTFYRDGDFFVLDNMNREFKELSLRTGISTQLTILIDNREIRLYELVEDGTKIDLIVSPLWKILF